MRILTTSINVAVSPNLRTRLEIIARRQQRTLSSTVRVILEESLKLHEVHSSSERSEYEASLTLKQATKLQRLGYELTPASTSFRQLPLPGYKVSGKVKTLLHQRVSAPPAT